MACCWALNPVERPSMAQLQVCMQDFYTALGRFIQTTDTNSREAILPKATVNMLHYCPEDLVNRTEFLHGHAGLYGPQIPMVEKLPVYCPGHHSKCCITALGRFIQTCNTNGREAVLPRTAVNMLHYSPWQVYIDQQYEWQRSCIAQDTSQYAALLPWTGLYRPPITMVEKLYCPGQRSICYLTAPQICFL